MNQNSSNSFDAPPPLGYLTLAVTPGGEGGDHTNDHHLNFQDHPRPRGLLGLQPSLAAQWSVVDKWFLSQHPRPTIQETIFR